MRRGHTRHFPQNAQVSQVKHLLEEGSGQRLHLARIIQWSPGSDSNTFKSSSVILSHYITVSLPLSHRGRVRTVINGTGRTQGDASSCAQPLGSSSTANLQIQSRGFQSQRCHSPPLGRALPSHTAQLNSSGPTDLNSHMLTTPNLFLQPNPVLSFSCRRTPLSHTDCSPHSTQRDSFKTQQPALLLTQD